uniref:ABC transporter n=1 Tax=Schistosoma mansoni TaxID=6183 RepID=A0A5K4F9F4_SCHMA
MITYVGVFSCLVTFLPFVHMVTLEQAMSDPDKYIRYDTGDFNIGMHVGLSLLINYGILSTAVLFIVIVSKALGYKRKRHG